jgi:hypothetical protein
VAPPEPKEKAAKGGGGKGSDDRMAVWRDELRQQLQDEQHFFADSKTEELAFWQQKLALVQGGSDQDVKLRRQVNDQIFQLQKALAQQEERLALERIGSDQKITDERSRASLPSSAIWSAARSSVAGAAAGDGAHERDGVAGQHLGRIAEHDRVGRRRRADHPQLEYQRRRRRLGGKILPG